LNPCGPTFVGNDITPKLTAASNGGASDKEQTDEGKVKERPILGWGTRFGAKYAKKIRMGSKAALGLEGTNEEEEGGGGYGGD
jgi:hypothetical protein